MHQKNLSALFVASAFFVAGPSGTIAQEKQDSAEAPLLDPKGSPDQRLMRQLARYYVWHDGEGWHVRSAANKFNTFQGRVRVEGGQFRKLRTVGFETRGGAGDQMVVDDKRQEVQFLIKTGTSFDGFDFTVDRSATELHFDLQIAGKEHPKRIFIGRKAGHPRKASFTLPADPDQVDQDKATAAASKP